MDYDLFSLQLVAYNLSVDFSFLNVKKKKMWERERERVRDRKDNKKHKCVCEYANVYIVFKIFHVAPKNFSKITKKH